MVSLLLNMIEVGRFYILLKPVSCWVGMGYGVKKFVVWVSNFMGAHVYQCILLKWRGLKSELINLVWKKNLASVIFSKQWHWINRSGLMN